MLITSQCGEYALLGRKAAWPEGRYSTLAGFCEVGETLEQCCAREVQEESGVEVDLESISFTHSQPWPFPRSLMAGFRGKAKQSGDELAKIVIEEDEMQDVRWFKKDYVRDRLSGGSLALNFEPNEKEKEFHIPGQSSLATLLITEWTNES
jgi:NAD+ diphosphatase